MTTYADPKHLRTSRRARKSVPHAWGETACGHGADAKQVEPMINVMDCMRMIRQNMISRRQTETEGPAEEEEAENNPVVRIRVWISAFDIRIVESGKDYHPQRS